MKVISGKFYRAIWILGIAALTLYYVVALKNIWDQMAPAPPQQEGKKSYPSFFVELRDSAYALYWREAE